jgi:HAD superfamily hydrolase (TIGR01509 family)
VTKIRAFLVDVYETLLAYDAEARFGALAGIANVDPAAWRDNQLSLRGPRDRGEVSSAESFALSLAACGADPAPELVAKLVKADRDFMRAYAPLYDDAVPFLKELRSRGFAIALVSNCADSTRPLLGDLDLLPLADHVILSCEVRSAKPSPEVYRIALDALGVPAADAAMVDDQPAYLRGAAAVGVRGIQIVRDTGQPDPAFTPVRNLLDVFALL